MVLGSSASTKKSSYTHLGCFSYDDACYARLISSLSWLWSLSAPSLGLMFYFWCAWSGIFMVQQFPWLAITWILQLVHPMHAERGFLGLHYKTAEPATHQPECLARMLLSGLQSTARAVSLKHLKISWNLYTSKILTEIIPVMSYQKSWNWTTRSLIGKWPPLSMHLSQNIW